MQSNIFISLLFLPLFFISISIYCAPTETTTNLETVSGLENSPQILHNQDTSATNSRRGDYYEYRHVVAQGVQTALDECREKFKWDRWNCPKKAFLDIIERNQLPSNKELGLTRALIASGIVLSLTRSCSYGTNNVCGCSPSAALTNLLPGPQAQLQAPPKKFIWRGCDESVKFAFKVSKVYLDWQDKDNQQLDEASRRINAHNYEVGRLAVKRTMKMKCKCHGVSGSCQVQTCWKSVPDMSMVGDYLKRQYRSAAKVGAMSAEETNIVSLNKELTSIKTEKLVFADASPDYCYENPKLGINGTLGRYCSRTNGDSCDRLCTKCGYKVKRESLLLEKQCNCRFVFCCSVECQRCPRVEETYRCVKHHSQF